MNLFLYFKPTQKKNKIIIKTMKLYQQYIFLLLIIFTFQQKKNQQLNNDITTCIAADTSSWKSVSLSNRELECCKILTDYYGNSLYSSLDFSFCSVSTSQKMTSELIDSAERIYRESFGFVSTMMLWCFLSFFLYFFF